MYAAFVGGDLSSCVKKIVQVFYFLSLSKQIYEELMEGHAPESMQGWTKYRNLVR
jgi:hypothetical protein